MSFYLVALLWPGDWLIGFPPRLHHSALILCSWLTTLPTTSPALLSHANCLLLFSFQAKQKAEAAVSAIPTPSNLLPNKLSYCVFLP